MFDFVVLLPDCFLVVELGGVFADLLVFDFVLVQFLLLLRKLYRVSISVIVLKQFLESW